QTLRHLLRKRRLPRLIQTRQITLTKPLPIDTDPLRRLPNNTLHRHGRLIRPLRALDEPLKRRLHPRLVSPQHLLAVTERVDRPKLPALGLHHPVTSAAARDGRTGGTGGTHQRREHRAGEDRLSLAPFADHRVRRPGDVAAGRVVSDPAVARPPVIGFPATLVEVLFAGLLAPV